MLRRFLLSQRCAHSTLSLLSLPLPLPTPPLGRHGAPGWAPGAARQLPTALCFTCVDEVCQSQPLSSSRPLHPLLSPQVRYVCVSSCPANGFISASLLDSTPRHSQTMLLSLSDLLLSVGQILGVCIFDRMNTLKRLDWISASRLTHWLCDVGSRLPALHPSLFICKAEIIIIITTTTTAPTQAGTWRSKPASSPSD